MTQTQTTRRRGRAILLAAIMLLSAVTMSAVFAGPVTAQQLDDRTPQDTTVQPGDTVTVTVQFSSDEENIDLYNEEIASGSSVGTITSANSNEAQAAVNEDGTSASALYALSSVDGDTVSVTVSIADDAADGDTVTLSGTVVTSDGNEIDTGTTTITVQEQDDDDSEPPSAGPFNVQNLDPTSVSADPGEQITVSATIINEGTTAGNTTVSFTIDGDSVAQQDVTNLDADNNTQVEFTVNAPDTPGTYEHGIETADSSQTGTLEVGGTNFEVSQLDPTDETVQQGDPISVSALITNTGSVSGDADVAVEIGGVEQAQQSLTLSAGGTSTIVFSSLDTSSLSPGQYSYFVFTGDDSSEAGSLVIEPSVVTYQGDSGVVDTNGLLTALSDWRNDEIETQLLLDVLAEWRANR